MAHQTIYFTDVEGDKVRLDQFLALNAKNGVVIKQDASGDYIHIPDGVTLVFGGDLIDRFENDMYLIKLILNTAKNNPNQADQKQKFVYIAGNRELNKERYSELNDGNVENTAIDNIGHPFWVNEGSLVTFAQFMLEQMFEATDARLKDLLPESGIVDNDGSEISKLRAAIVANKTAEAQAIEALGEKPADTAEKAIKDEYAKGLKAVQDAAKKARTTLLRDSVKNADIRNYLKAYASRFQTTDGLTVEANRNEILEYSYLLWMHRDTMGCPNTVAYRTKELGLNSRGAVLNHFKDSVKPDGWVRQLLAITQLFYVDGKIFVTHGKAPDHLLFNNGRSTSNLRNFCIYWNNWYQILLNTSINNREKTCALLNDRYTKPEHANVDVLVRMALPESSFMTDNMNVQTPGNDGVIYHHLQPNDASVKILKDNGVDVCMTGHKPLSKLGQIATLNEVTFLVPDTSNFEERGVFVNVVSEDNQASKITMTCIDRPDPKNAAKVLEVLETKLVAGQENNGVGLVFKDADSTPGVIRHQYLDGEYFVQIAKQENGSPFAHLNNSKKMPLNAKPSEQKKDVVKQPQNAADNGSGIGSGSNESVPNSNKEAKKSLLPKMSKKDVLLEEVISETAEAKKARLDAELLKIAKEQVARLNSTSHFYTYRKESKATRINSAVTDFVAGNEVTVQKLLREMHDKRSHLSPFKATSWKALSKENQQRLVTKKKSFI